MSEVTKSTVKTIAQLARLRLSDQEQTKTATDLNGIFTHFSKIQEIDTKSVPTSDDVTGLTNITRADEAKPASLCSHQDLLSRAPATHHNQIKVKSVLRGKV